MRKGLAGALMLSGALFILNSCKDDPAPNTNISFEKTEESTTESDGTTASFHPELQAGGVGKEIKVKLKLDRAVAENTVISYTVSGTASKKNGTQTSNGSTYKTYSDFYLEGTNANDSETLVIEKGSAEAELSITVFEDYDFEVDDESTDGNYVETVILTLGSVVSGPAQLSTDGLVYTLTIQEDDILIVMGWETADGTNDADLDLIAKTGGKVANASANESADGSLKTGGEGLILPGGFPAGTYQLSYPYFSGTSNNVNFTIYMLNTAGTLNGKSYPYSGSSALSFNGNYNVQNVHKYEDLKNFTDVTTVAQTMTKSGINYSNISAISTTNGTSRLKPSSLVPVNLSKEYVKRLTQNLNLGRK